MTSQNIPIDRYLLASLMPDLVGHDRAPSAYLLYLTLWRLVEGELERTAAASLQTLASQSGLSKTAVQRAVIHLRRRGLISTTQDSPTAAPRYRLHTPWRVKATLRHP